MNTHVTDIYHLPEKDGVAICNDLVKSMRINTEDSKYGLASASHLYRHFEKVCGSLAL